MTTAACRSRSWSIFLGPATVTFPLDLVIDGQIVTSPSVTLRGDSTVIGSPNGDGLLVSGTTFDFGRTMAGTTSSTQVVHVTNTTAAPISFATGSAPLGPFTTPPTGTCQGQSLAPGDSCTVPFAFAPSTLGPATVTFPLDLTMNGTTTSSHTITLAGTGVAGLTLSPRVLDFGDVPITTTSAIERGTSRTPPASRSRLSPTGSPDLGTVEPAQL